MDGLPQEPERLPIIVAVAHDEYVALLGASRDILSRSKLLVEFMDTHRDVAKMAGVETLAIEMSSILEGERLQAMVDTLHESARREADAAQVTLDGLDVMRRAEMLLAEAVRNMDRYVPSMATSDAAGQPRMVDAELAAAPAQQPMIIQYTPPAAPASDNTALWIVFSIFAAAAAATTVYLLTTRK